MMHFSLRDLYQIVTVAVFVVGLHAIFGIYKDTTLLFAMLGTTIGNRIWKLIERRYGQDD